MLQIKGPSITHEPSPTAHSTHPDQQFRSVAQSSSLLHEYSGILPCSRDGTRHILRCEHLRQLPGSRFPPYRADPSYTHQLWLWYKRPDNPERLILVFRGQFGVDIEGRDPDLIALKITHFIANYLINMTDPQRGVRQDDGDIFWATLIDNYLNTLKRKRFQETDSIQL